MRVHLMGDHRQAACGISRSDEPIVPVQKAEAVTCPVCADLLIEADLSDAPKAGC